MEPYPHVKTVASAILKIITNNKSLYIGATHNNHVRCVVSFIIMVQLWLNLEVLLIHSLILSQNIHILPYTRCRIQHEPKYHLCAIHYDLTFSGLATVMCTQITMGVMMCKIQHIIHSLREPEA